VDSVDFERLLEKKWGDLKHLETERHWFLGAFAVFVAGNLAFLSQINENNVSGISQVHVYSVLSFLALIGLLHALRISWMLLKLQNDITEIVQKWQEGAGSSDKQIREFWSYTREEGILKIGNHWAFVYGVTPIFSTGRWHLWKIPLPSGVRFPPSLASLHVWIYLGSVLFFFLLVCATT